MTQADNNNNLDEIIRQMREEFGERRPPEEPPSGDPRRLPPPAPSPVPPSAPRQPSAGRAQFVQGGRTQGFAKMRPGSTFAGLLLVINIAVYLISGLLSLNIFSPSAAVLQFLGWKDNQLIYNGEYWRLLSATFLHGNLVHIFFNGYALSMLGPESERIYGSGRFLALYMLAGLAGSIASYALTPGPSVGASGAIFGMIGGLAIFYYLNRRTFGEFGRMQLQSMVAVIAINLLIGFSAGGVIDNFAHLGGLIGGAIAGYGLAPRFSVDTRLYPPVLVRRYEPWGWGIAVALLILLLATTLLITPPA